MQATSTFASLRGESVSRRGLIVSAGVAGLAAATRPYGAFAAGPETTLKVGFISPRTGKLGGFGETDGYILELARKSLASGLKVDDKTYGVNVLDRDTQSDPSRAGQLAKTLINSDKIDMMLVVSTPETINPVADACEAAGVPCMSTVMPWEAWYFGRGAKPGQPSPFKWTFHFGFGGGEFFKTYVSQWSLIETNKKVGVLYPNDADGNAIRENLAPALAKAGFTIIDPGPYEDGTTDYSARSRSSRRRNARSSTRSRSRPTSSRFGAKPPSRATPRWSRSPRSQRPGSSPPK
jgi:branched-chain amino acid transport system substrate-binding protein